jgi:hypothetical protein
MWFSSTRSRWVQQEKFWNQLRERFGEFLMQPVERQRIA